MRDMPEGHWHWHWHCALTGIPALAVQVQVRASASASASQPRAPKCAVHVFGFSGFGHTRAEVALVCGALVGEGAGE
jgi:hypothetical protein